MLYLLIDVTGLDALALPEKRPSTVFSRLRLLTKQLRSQTCAHLFVEEEMDTFIRYMLHFSNKISYNEHYNHIIF